MMNKEPQTYLNKNSSGETAVQATDSQFCPNSMSLKPYKLVQKLSIRSPNNISSKLHSYDALLEGSFEHEGETRVVPGTNFESLDFKNRLSYNKTINLEVLITEEPEAIKAIRYIESKNFMKALGGCFLKALILKEPCVKNIGDKDCLISVKVWNALFDERERENGTKLEESKVSIFLKRIQELNEKISTRNWLDYFLEFILDFDINSFETHGKVEKPERILLYKMRCSVLKAAFRTFNNLLDSLRGMNVKITGFKLREIYKTWAVLSFETDYCEGDQKLTEFLTIKLDQMNPAAPKSMKLKQSPKSKYKGLRKNVLENNLGLADRMKQEFRRQSQQQRVSMPLNSQFSVRFDEARDTFLDQKQKLEAADVVYLDPESIHKPFDDIEYKEKLRNFISFSAPLFIDSLRKNYLDY